MVSDAENISIWWRYHERCWFIVMHFFLGENYQMLVPQEYYIYIVITSSYFCHALFFIAAYGGAIYPYSPLYKHIDMLHEIWCQRKYPKIQGARSKWHGVTHFGVSYWWFYLNGLPREWANKSRLLIINNPTPNVCASSTASYDDVMT